MNDTSISKHTAIEDELAPGKILHCIPCYLSAVELGQDPTTSILLDDSPERQAVQAYSGREDLQDYPTFSITMDGGNGRNWLTIGPPMWVSSSFLGRATSVWRVAKFKDGRLRPRTLIMKNAWRGIKRAQELTIYQATQGDSPEAATFHHEADVLFPEGGTITVNALRSGVGLTPDTPTLLHRLSLTTGREGRPLWEYDDELTLYKGFRAAIRGEYHDALQNLNKLISSLVGHELLCAQGILHRDISADNVLLATGTVAGPGGEGFVADLESARLERYVINVEDHLTTIVQPIPRSGRLIITEPKGVTRWSSQPICRGAAIYVSAITGLTLFH